MIIREHTSLTRTQFLTRISISSLLIINLFFAFSPSILAQAPPPAATATPTGSYLNPFEAPRQEFFELVDPLNLGGGANILTPAPSAQTNTLRSPAGIINRFLDYAFPLAGLILFVMLVWGGFEILIKSPGQKSLESGKQRVTAAFIGFFLLFASYWIWQIIEVVFGVKIL